MKTIVDSDALLGIAKPTDPHHISSLRILDWLKSQTADVFLLPTTIGEFALVATSRIGLSDTKKMVVNLSNPPYIILPVSEELTHEACHIYQQQTSKEESLFDCYIMVAATRYKVDCIFSFDRGYTKNGLVLAEDFFKKRAVA